jgi:presenilin-like A22 family membrane protease
MIALGTIAGSLIGLILLMRIVMKGNPQAGLPLLNTGALLGFFITYLLVFGLNFSYIQ